MRRKLTAFTLVELLVVVSILALLISILLPSLKKARDQAKQIRCLANLKQIGDAMVTYTVENNGYFTPKLWMSKPEAKSGSIYCFLGKGGARPGYRWIEKRGADARWLNYPYLLKSKPNARDEFETAKCPTGEDRGAKRDENIVNLRIKTNYDDFGTSYASNHNTNWASLLAHGDSLDAVQAEQIVRPGLLVAIGEDGAFGNSWKTYKRPYWHGKPDSFNITFADGHAEFIRVPWGEPIGRNYRFVEPERMPDTFDMADPYDENDDDDDLR